jgi:hypothetical protein
MVEPLMNRRRFIQAAAATFAAIGVPLRAAAPSSYGYVDVSIARANGWHPATVLLDGDDVSNDCFALDDRSGFVKLFKRNAHGKPYFDYENRAVATAQRFGKVTFIPKGSAV